MWVQNVLQAWEARFLTSFTHNWEGHAFLLMLERILNMEADYGAKMKEVNTMIYLIRLEVQK